MIDLIRIWLARHCLECGRRKPKFTAICNDCADHFGLEHGLMFYGKGR